MPIAIQKVLTLEEIAIRKEAAARKAKVEAQVAYNKLSRGQKMTLIAGAPATVSMYKPIELLSIQKKEEPTKKKNIPIAKRYEHAPMTYLEKKRARERAENLRNYRATHGQSKGSLPNTR